MRKVLVLDIETSPMLAYIWQLKDQYVGVNQIHTDWHIMAWSAMWQNDPKSLVYYDLRNHNPGNDLPILRPLWKLLNEADITVTQNGEVFDSKKINARFMLNGMKPPKPYVHHDTYKILKKVADFTSHSLEYLTNKFCKKYKKLSHKKFPGLSLWIQCLKGNIEAWNEMEKYNKHDVLSTDELYSKIKPWIPDSLPKVYSITDFAKECGSCGYYGKMRKGKPRIAKTYEYTQHICPKCGHWQKAERLKEKKK